MTTAEHVAELPTERLWPAGTLRVAVGTCPGCAGPSHTGLTCDGKTTDEVIAVVWPDADLDPAERRR